MHYFCPECDRSAKTIDALRKTGCNCKVEPLLMTDPIDHPKSTKEKQTSNKKIAKAKGRINSHYVESIIVNGKPVFLCNVDGELQLAEKLEQDGIIFRPLESNESGYYPYKFDMMMLDLLKTNPPTREGILDEIKVIVDDYVDAPERDKCLIMGDLLLSYCQEWIDTLHFPFFVGETESGKSTALHIFRHLGYRCLYGEDIPNADIYNFLGTDEEATGTICEDEAQEIAVNREKIRTYKNSYSRGALKPRIVGTDSNNKRQVFYKTFCLKLFAGERIPEDKGFKERLAVVHMTEGSPKKNIKRLAKDDKERIYHLRNKILVWKVQNIDLGLEHFDSDLKKRDQELWEDFLAVTYGTKYFDVCQDVVKYYTTQRHQAIWNSLESRILKLVIDRLDERLSIRLESLWIYLMGGQDELGGESNRGTFFPYDFSAKISRNYLSKMFEEKFRAKKVPRYKTIDGRKHLNTEYIFDSETILKLVQKYNIEISIDSPLHGGRSGGGDSKS